MRYVRDMQGTERTTTTTTRRRSQDSMYTTTVQDGRKESGSPGTSDYEARTAAVYSTQRHALGSDTDRRITKRACHFEMMWEARARPVECGRVGLVVSTGVMGVQY